MFQIFESLRMRVDNEIENEMRVFLESLNFEIEMRVSQKSAMTYSLTWSEDKYSVEI